MEYDYLLVGAGLFGAVFARQATDMGKKVLVIDKRDHIAGNVYTEAVEAKSWAFLFLLSAVFFGLKQVLVPITGWTTFLAAVGINFVFGYVLTVLVLMNKEEKRNIFGKLKSKF